MGGAEEGLGVYGDAGGGGDGSGCGKGGGGGDGDGGGGGGGGDGDGGGGGDGDCSVGGNGGAYTSRRTASGQRGAQPTGTPHPATTSVDWWCPGSDPTRPTCSPPPPRPSPPLPRHRPPAPPLSCPSQVTGPASVLVTPAQHPVPPPPPPRYRIRRPVIGGRGPEQVPRATRHRSSAVCTSL